MIKAIYISKTRNGFIEMPPNVEVVAGKGILGDRYFEDSNRKSRDYEITFIEAEQIDAFNERSKEKVEYWQPRRNILTQEINLMGLIGRYFQIGTALFEGIESCEPCELLRSRTTPEAFKWFVGRGGIRAGIIGTGTIKVGDLIEPIN